MKIDFYTIGHGVLCAWLSKTINSERIKSRKSNWIYDTLLENFTLSQILKTKTLSGKNTP
jgi:hypothetical protein